VRYDDRLVRLSTIQKEKLPDLRPAVELLGPLRAGAAEELGLRPGIPVVAGSPDVQTAAVGSGAVGDFDGHLYIGTSSWLACHVPYKKTDLLHNMASLPSAIPGRYLLTNEQECAGGCLNYLVDKILFPLDELATGRPPEVYERLNQVAGRAPAGSGKLIFTPWLYGERTPVDDHLARGGFFNQALHTGREHLIRSVFEGVAYNTRWLLTYVEKFIRRPLEGVTMVGGGAISDLWCQIHADVLNRPIRQAREPKLVNLRGAAFLALVALGRLAYQQVPACVPIARTYTPDPANRGVYDELFQEYVHLYQRSRKVFARLNRTT
jgi:xylulokinase